MLAVKSGRGAVVDYLLQNGANPTIVDEKGRTPLHHAVAVNMPIIVKQLLDTNRINVHFFVDYYSKILLVMYLLYPIDHSCFKKLFWLENIME